MKPRFATCLAVLGLAATLAAWGADLTIPSDGSDEDFAPTADTVVDLSKAADGRWDASNTANRGNGIYDKDKWAVVFKYRSVNIPAGVRVTFKNHRTVAPVVWLVQGEVVINGVINLSGGDGLGGDSGLDYATPGPGGFRGGVAGAPGTGPGNGPGGGYAYGDYADVAGAVYGNTQIMPLIGGSGVGGAGNMAGGAGGGAILIAAPGTVAFNGLILSNGGKGGQGFGSGGAVRIIASSVEGTGEIDCFRTRRTMSGAYGRSPGRIRLETFSLAPAIRTFPETIGVPPEEPPRPPSGLASA